MAGRLPRGRPPRASLSHLQSDRPERILLVFVDGVGIGAGDPSRNPFAVAEIPTIQALLDGARPVSGEIGPAGLSGPAGGLRPIDATLGVAGRPQSGTGQTALLTGINAPERLGRHFGPWVPTALRALLESDSIFQRARAAGRDVAFANAYPAGHLDPGGRTARRPGAFPFAARAAALLDRDEAALRAGNALASSITTDAWRRHVDPLAPPVEPAAAGRLLARISTRHDLTVFAHYDTDYVGHRGGMAEAVEAVERVDRFLGGVLTGLPAEALLLVTSDHGNLEEVGVGHTLNRVPLLAVGRGAAEALRTIEAITDVARWILRRLDSEGGIAGGAGEGPGGGG